MNSKDKRILKEERNKSHSVERKAKYLRWINIVEDLRSEYNVSWDTAKKLAKDPWAMHGPCDMGGYCRKPCNGDC